MKKTMLSVLPTKCRTNILRLLRFKRSYGYRNLLSGILIAVGMDYWMSVFQDCYKEKKQLKVIKVEYLRLVDEIYFKVCQIC